MVIVDDEAIAAVNRQYLQRSGPTNVISFAMREGPFGDIRPELLGDVVISADTAQREAEAADMPVNERLTELLVHGMLHLFGYDHETPQADAAAMEEKSRELMDIVGRLDPENEAGLDR